MKLGRLLGGAARKATAVSKDKVKETASKANRAVRRRTAHSLRYDLGGYVGRRAADAVYPKEMAAADMITRRRRRSPAGTNRESRNVVEALARHGTKVSDSLDRLGEGVRTGGEAVTAAAVDHGKEVSAAVRRLTRLLDSLFDEKDSALGVSVPQGQDEKSKDEEKDEKSGIGSLIVRKPTASSRKRGRKERRSRRRTGSSRRGRRLRGRSGPPRPARPGVSGRAMRFLESLRKMSVRDVGETILRGAGRALRTGGSLLRGGVIGGLILYFGEKAATSAVDAINETLDPITGVTPEHREEVKKKIAERAWGNIVEDGKKVFREWEKFFLRDGGPLVKYGDETKRPGPTFRESEIESMKKMRRDWGQLRDAIETPPPTSPESSPTNSPVPSWGDRVSSFFGFGKAQASENPSPTGGVSTSPTAPAEEKGERHVEHGHGHGEFDVVGSAAAQGIENVDPRLVDVLKEASTHGDYRVELYSGFRKGDRRRHGRGIASDVRLINKKTGEALANYQDEKTFREYEKFAQSARAVQMKKYPELDDKFSWGGYFSGERGKYGAVDTMHFDLGGKMAGGSWSRGLTKKQRALWPGAESVGMGDQKKWADQFLAPAPAPVPQVAETPPTNPAPPPPPEPKDVKKSDSDGRDGGGPTIRAARRMDKKPSEETIHKDKRTFSRYFGTDNEDDG